MAYIGNEAQTAFTSFDRQSLTGNGTAGPYTLSHSVANEQEIEVFVNFVRQRPGDAYTASGNQLTMTGNVASTDDFYVVFQGKAIQTVVPPAGSVTDSMITGLSSSKLTGALPALDGSSFTNHPVGGKVLQVVHAGDFAEQSLTSVANTPVATNITATITPAMQASKILITYTICTAGQHFRLWEDAHSGTRFDGWTNKALTLRYSSRNCNGADKGASASNYAMLSTILVILNTTTIQPVQYDYTAVRFQHDRLYINRSTEQIQMTINRADGYVQYHSHGNRSITNGTFKYAQSGSRSA